MLAILLLHFVAACLGPFLASRIGRNTLLVLAVAPASAAAWALSQTSRAFSATPPESKLNWVSELGLSIVFRLDPLSWLMTVLVGGIGALVMVYASRYFSKNAANLGRFASIFVSFAAAMLGLVTADHLLIIYLFWELTTVFSFLLIGHHYDRRVARAAARQAIQITGFGGLAMFAGFIMIAQAHGGTYSVASLVARVQMGTYFPTHSGQVIVGAMLIILGAATKSALVPHHFWLPGAMAAPTPVSAYLHAAAMVKAGVYLVARLTPGFTNIPGWSAVLVTLGLATMLLGGYRALRQFDLKLVLAYGTVSQLGLMVAAVGYGTAATMAAGIVMLIAHAVFKSALFMSVGLVEKTTGTRDLRELTGLRTYKPVLATAAGILAVSMAGIPPLLGYMGKEAFITSFIDGTDAAWLQAFGDGSGTGRGIDLVALLILAIGSIFTVAYSWRYWWGAFAKKRLRVEMEVDETPKLSAFPIVLLAAASFAGLYPAGLQKLTEHIAGNSVGTPHIALWSGPMPAAVTAVIIAGGVFMAWKRPAVARIQRRLEPKRLQVTEIYHWSLLELEVVASRVTAMFQRGSLPWDITTIMVVFTGSVAYALFQVEQTEIRLRLWDSVAQLGIIGLAIVAALATVQAKSRIKAVLALGVVGTAVALLYMTHGAPDLALTQMLVEVVSLVVFVLVLRSLPRHFSVRPLVASRWARMGLSAMVGVVVVGAGVLATQARVALPVSRLIPAEAYSFGAGENVVNVILVDVRAWDTVGELSVLLVTATGVASLIYLTRRSVRIDGSKPSTPGVWLPAMAKVPRQSRSLLLEVGTRLLFPTMIIVSIWLLLIGHNNPGGGFAGGVLAGIAFILRYMAGGRHELGEALPVNPGRLLGLGLFIAAAGGALPLAYGNTVLQSTEINLSLGFLGELHFTSALVVDIGVYILVVAVVLDLITAMGAQIDRDRTNAGKDSTSKEQVNV
ncbi:MAG: Na+/H+ antiporter subunit A [Actinomycetaceae bacterium]|nr:Na+/H+ antiporter subunit A [Actinomycetaceae bacterium]